MSNYRPVDGDAMETAYRTLFSGSDVEPVSGEILREAVERMFGSVTSPADPTSGDANVVDNWAAMFS